MNVPTQQTGLSQTIKRNVVDFIYLYLKFAFYALVIYILFYYYDYYFG